MWVLSARENAEKIWYAIIWEETKEASNVIDYNINSEITKDTSAVFNANNDTTTGMANVIPWVNAPKLIAKTSIIWIETDSWYVGGIELRIKWAEQTIEPWEDYSELITDVFYERNERWYYDFKYVDGKWVIIPASWAYKLECTYFWSGSTSWISGTFETLVWNDTVHTSATITWETSETFTINAPKWAALRFRSNTTTSRHSPIINEPHTWVTITKL